MPRAEWTSRHLPDDVGDALLTIPPSDEPAEYVAWLKSLPPAGRRRVDAICRATPTAYRSVCGGIGPLHMPLPPRTTAHVRRADEPRSRFASLEARHRALTAEQRRYVQRHCPGGEDQPSSELCGENTPLVAVFDGGAVAFTHSSAARVFAFALRVPIATDWPTAATPWIALDRDVDGRIDSGAELFGNHTPVGAGAVNGFAALHVLDTNGDGRIDAADRDFARLLLWSDRDGDRRSTVDELGSAAATIESISLADRVEPRCDARDNCEGERATLLRRDADGGLHRGCVVDVCLPTR